jgi:hypothetical protein
VCAAGLAAWSAETRGRREQLANRRQYLCRAIFQYRDAVDVVGDNRRPWSSKRARVISEPWKRRRIFEFGSGSSKAERGPLMMPGKRQT